MPLLVVLHIASTWFMAGVIWVVQLVHYPLFRLVGYEQFAQYEQAHTFWITWVVAPAMLLEAATALLLFWMPPPKVSKSLLWLNLASVGIIWLSTAFLQVPCHQRLSLGFDPLVHQRLVQTNWIRTLVWTVRSVAWLVWLVKVLPA